MSFTYVATCQTKATSLAQEQRNDINARLQSDPLTLPTSRKVIYNHSNRPLGRKATLVNSGDFCNAILNNKKKGRRTANEQRVARSLEQAITRSSILRMLLHLMRAMPKIANTNCYAQLPFPLQTVSKQRN